MSELAPLHPRDNTFPGEVFLHVAADALNWCGASRADPLPLEGLRERFLPETTFRGRQNTKLRYAPDQDLQFRRQLVAREHEGGARRKA